MPAAGAVPDKPVNASGGIAVESQPRTNRALDSM
jgi:hypothetical protein